MTTPGTHKSRPNLVALAVAAALAVCGSREKVQAAQLPVPCGGAACGGRPWLGSDKNPSSSSGSLVQGANTLTVNQYSATAVFNWQSFNVSADGKVNFVQPSSSAVAINNIYQGSVSNIFGSLSSNGVVYLLNQNGILFGTGSTVNVGGLLASSLRLNDSVETKGLAAAGAAESGPTLRPWTELGEVVNKGAVTVAPGASVTANNGQILLFAPTVTNSGTLSSPNGQTMLGAGQSIYLRAAGDSSPVRGLIIGVGGCEVASSAVECTPTVTNTGGPGQPLGQIIANTGNVTLAGLAVNQNGRVSATTSIRTNGSIVLQAQAVAANSGGAFPDPAQSGKVTLGDSSLTSVSLEGSPDDKTVDVNVQLKSSIALTGGQINLLDHASVSAPSGNVTLTAVTDPSPIALPALRGSHNDTSRIYLAPTSSIDVSGATVSKSASDNSLLVELRGSQTADFPAQRAGPLRGQKVYVDTRVHGTYSDGTMWVGTPIAGLAGDVSAIQRNVFERNLTGGNISLNAGGSVIVSSGANLDISGGQINWQAGYVKSSVLVAPNGKLTPIGQANPNITYLGTLDTISQGDPHWGVVANFTLPGYSANGMYQPAYVEGKDAGNLSIIAPAFVLDGTVAARRVVGTLQRAPTDPNFAANPYYKGMIYRFADQVPLGGTLTLGNSNMRALTTTDAKGPQRGVLGNLTFASGLVLPTLQGPNGGAFDPTQDLLPAGFVSSVRPDLLSPGNLTNLSVYADGAVTVPAAVSLAPGAGANIVFLAGSLDFAGSVISNGGTVALQSIPTPFFGGSIANAPVNSPVTSLVMENTARLDLRGAWVNDGLASNTPQPPLYINGGSVTIGSVEGGLVSIASGARIDVSGGAQRTVTRSIVAGGGGSITIAAAPTLPQIGQNPVTVDLPLDLSANLAAYALADGGKLSLTLPSLCVSSVACTDPAAYRFDPHWFSNMGFGSLALFARPTQNGSLNVASDVNVHVSQQNFALLANAFNKGSAANLAGLTQIVTLPDYMRHSASLKLQSAAQVYDRLTYADLIISAGANLELDPQATIDLSTNSRLFLNGRLRVPDGTVNVAINGQPTGENKMLLPDQAIWLGDSAVIDVSGTTVRMPSNNGLLQGKVLGGGSVSISAGFGYVLGSQGAQILAGGTSGTLDLHPPGTNVYTRQTVASSGGSIVLSAAEGIQYAGSLLAPAGGAGVLGGSLDIELDGIAPRTGIPGGFSNTGSDPARTVIVTAAETPFVVAEGASTPGFLNGVGRISATQITAGGFDNVTLHPRDLVIMNPPGSSDPGSNLPPIHGVVAFESGVSLAPRQSLVIDSSDIRGVGPGSVQLASNYIRLGSSETAQAQTPAIGAAAGSATFSASANLIDLTGSATLSGFRSAALMSSGDIRLTGVRVDNDTNPLHGFAGSFTSASPLTLSAQQIYPTTLSNFTVRVAASDPTQSVLTIGRAPGVGSQVLSAVGSVTFQATNIVDAGVIKAPIGSITLQASSVDLQAGAVLSVSAAGTTIPFGQTQGGFDWAYTLLQPDPKLPPSVVTVYGTGKGDTSVPTKQVTVNATNFNFESGAKIDTSGGGDLLAYEWIPGLGGNKDVLSTQNSGLYAVLPGVNLPYAPFDPNESKGFLTGVGSSVYLSGGAGLPAGTYALLPARYALLPGAYLVKAAPGFTDLAAGQTLPQLDGSTVVSGYRVYAGTGLRDARTSGFNIVSGSYALDSTQSTHTLAQYTVTGANAFFAAQAKTNKVATPRLPADAGSLALNLTTSAQLQGTLMATASAGHRGGTVDITAGNLFVTNQPANAPAGAVALDVNQLNQLGTESLLLGATRTNATNYTQLNVYQGDITKPNDGNIVEIDSGAVLKAPEVILAASRKIQLDAGAVVTATGSVTSGEPDLLAPVGTAVIRVATGAQVALNPAAANSPTGRQGSITVASGASIGAPGSVSVDAGGTVSFAGGISASGAAVRLGGQKLALGNVGAGFDGFVIGSNLISGLSGADLTLQVNNPPPPPPGGSPTVYGIEVHGPVQLGLKSLTVSGSGFVAAPDGDLTITAQDSVTLGNGGPPLLTTAPMTTARLSINAAHLNLSDGTFVASGFAATSLTASKDLTITGNGAFQTPGGIGITSPIIQSMAGKTFQITAGGSLTTAAPAGAASALTSVAGPGGAISFTGSDVTLGGNVVLPAGRITATATTGALSVAGGTVLDVSGFSRTFDGLVRSADGGTVRLVATHGDLDVASGSVIDVSAGSGGGAGGALSLVAPDGKVSLAANVRGTGASGSLGGSLNVEAQQLDFQALVALAGNSHFTKAITLHQRGAGDFLLSSKLQAQDVELTADHGNIAIGSSAIIDARADMGGKIVLAGQSIHLVGNSQLLAGATARADRGGLVELLSTDTLQQDADSIISVGGKGSTATGTVWLRAPEGSVRMLGTKVQLGSTVTGAANVYLEGYQTHNVGTSLSPSDQNDPTDATTIAGWINTAATFVTDMRQKVAAAGAVLLPGIELDAVDPAGLHIASDWDLSQYRFGGDGTNPGTIPGVLTLRTAGNLYVDHSISDGFTDATVGAKLLANSKSWSYRLVAGADFNSANPLAVAADPTTGSILVAKGTPVTMPGLTAIPGSPVMIRTGTGSIDLAAAGNLTLGNQASVIYTAGTPRPEQPYSDPRIDGFKYASLQLPAGGGSVTVSVGQDINGAPSDQLFNDWLWRAGRAAGASSYVPTSWTPAFAYFNQGIGALGGGDLTIRAGGDIHDLGAVVPSIGVPIGTATSATTTELNGGMLRVESGGNILGGKFLDMAGNATIVAGGAIAVGTAQTIRQASPAGLGLILGLGSGTFSVVARSDLMLDAAFEATLAPRATTQNRSPTRYALFSTYTTGSGLALQSTGGELNYANRTGVVVGSALRMGDLSMGALQGGELSILPPNLDAVALSGDISVSQPGATEIRSLTLWPAAGGNVNLLANGSIDFFKAGLVVSDADPASFPSVNNMSGNFDLLTRVGSTFTAGTPGLHAAQPMHGGAFAQNGQADKTPARIVALTGNITQTADDGGSYFIDVPKPIDVLAGGDIVNLQLLVQQFSAASTSSIRAGGDILYPFARNESGALVAPTAIPPGNIIVAGPGSLDIQAAGTINLGTSLGITSVGNLFNAALPASGANISVAAGLSQAPHYQDFINAYLVNGSGYDRQLEQFVENITGDFRLEKKDALAKFEALAANQQAPFLETILFNELREGGRSAAAPGKTHNDFTRAFTALTTLFPDAGKNRGKGETVPYNGDLLLYFSRVYTLQGGDINLLAPGGQVNVGLAVAPTSFGFTKDPAQLGVVAQSTGSANVLAYSDIQVNQSRVFAADGGNILMWSTFGDIDAGRGAKTAISAPPPVITIDANGKVTQTFSQALAGSGIQALATTDGTKPGHVDLFAPNGVVNANDAGIVAGDLTIAATAVLGANNISVSGTAVGLPPPALALGALTAGASSSSSAATSTAQTNLAESNKGRESQTPKTQAALSWLDVFVLGLGEDNCKTDDMECIKRQGNH